MITSFWTIAFLPAVVTAYGNYKYCCDIAKCQNVTAICEQATTRVRGKWCNETCPLDCKSYDTLANKDYSCYAQFLDKSSSPMNWICNQKYQAGKPAAPPIKVTYGFCKDNCAGWELSKGSQLSQWAPLLLQFLLPAVIFSMTIPRRTKLEVGEELFDFNLDPNHFFHALGSLLVAGVVVVMDSVIWIFTIFTCAGPMLVGSIHEAVLDHRVIAEVKDVLNKPELNSQGELESGGFGYHHQGELLLAVAAGNLDRDVKVAKTEPKDKSDKVLKQVLGLSASVDPDSLKSESAGPGPVNRALEPGASNPIERGPGDPSSGNPSVDRRKTKSSDDMVRTQCQLLNILSSQYSFGSTVGAPVLFYLGGFVYGTFDLASFKDDNDISLGFAFGMWWMVVVHVAIVSGCLLASNNPSTITGIAASTLAGLPEKEHAPIRVVSLYKWRFQPVSLWNRGCMKQSWIEDTEAWTSSKKSRSNVSTANTDRKFHERIQITYKGFIVIGLAAAFLIVLPGVLGILVSYYTPTICISCRSVTFLIYTCCQLWLIVLATWRAWYVSDAAGHNVKHNASLLTAFNDIWNDLVKHKRWIWASILVVVVIISLAAILMAFFTGFAGTLMQIIGVYRNCRCTISITMWSDPLVREKALIDLASDTQLARDMGGEWWMPCGIAAISFMSFVCYIGWWYQRHLRAGFEQRVRSLKWNIKKI